MIRMRIVQEEKQVHEDLRNHDGDYISTDNKYTTIAWLSEGPIHIFVTV